MATVFWVVAKVNSKKTSSQNVEARQPTYPEDYDNDKHQFPNPWEQKLNLINLINELDNFRCGLSKVQHNLVFT